MDRTNRSARTARAGVIAVATALAALTIGLHAGSASAHVAPITADCERGLVIALSQYDPAGVNTLRVWIDGIERSSTTFGAGTTVTFSFGDLTVTHDYRVVVTAWDDPDGKKGWSFDTGTKAIPVCATSTTATSTTAPSTTAPSTTAPSTTAPSTTAPSTTAPSTTAPSTTAPSTTAPSTTAPSTTAPSTTAVTSEPVVSTAPPPTISVAVVTPTVAPTVAPTVTPSVLPTVVTTVPDVASAGPTTVAKVANVANVAAVPATTTPMLPVTGGAPVGPIAALAAVLVGILLAFAARRPA
jgi:hypothetical protein